MQILHFDWLGYYWSISNSHRVAKFAGFLNLFILFYSQINIFFAEFTIAFFCPTSWVILKQLLLDPSPSRATEIWSDTMSGDKLLFPALLLGNDQYNIVSIIIVVIICTGTYSLYFIRKHFLQ